MAINEGLSSRADFNTALKEAGESVVRIRRGYTDGDGNRHPTEKAPQRVLIETVRLQTATTITDEGGANVAASSMRIIYMSPDDGEPLAEDVIERGRFRSELSDVDFLKVDDEIVYYFGVMVKTEEIKD